MTLYGFYFDLYSKSGKLLRAGTVYANTLSQMKINSQSVFWVITGNSGELVRITDAVFHQSEKGRKDSEKYTSEFGDFVLKYRYVKTRD